MDHSQGTWSAQAPAPEKSCELYIRDHPFRSIAIVSSTHALILRYSSPASEFSANGSHTSLPSTRRGGNGDSLVAKCMVEFTPVSEKLLKEYRSLSPRPIYGTLGLIAVNGEVFLSVISRASRAATVRPGETVEQILEVAFYCLSSADYDDVVPLESLETESYSDASSTYSGGTYGQGLSRREVHLEHPYHELRKLLSNRSFYYSTDFDITNRLQERPINSNSFDIDKFDETYLWNSYMIKPLAQFRSRLMPQEREALDASRILTSAIRGFCKTMTIPQSATPLKSSNGRASYLTLISRLSCLRAGTRFNARGIDDDGHVANFVESETTFWSPSGTVFSYAQVRGSVPIFWEQAADLIPGRQKITVTRGPDATQPTFDKHFDDLEQNYGAVHVLNLLSETKPSEVEVSNAYKTGIRNCALSQRREGESADHVLLRQTHYDFHAETKGPAGYEAARDIRKHVESSTDGFAYFLAEETDDHGQDVRRRGNLRLIVVLQQEGVFRTNCLDCLDRTNLIQTLISQMAIESFLGHRGKNASHDFWMRHSTLWADNGDNLSKIYAGTGALKSSFTRSGKMSIAGAMADMRKSVQRIYHNNFLDPSRQVTIDMLLGRLIGQAPVHLFDPISDFVSGELNKRNDEFTSFESISMWVGTLNLNGRTDGINQDLSAWLFPAPVEKELPDLYVVGFQEIVELSPQQIMNSDPSRKYMWEKSLQKALNERQERLGGEKYVLLRSGQLVGAALCIFVKAPMLHNIKNVEGSVKKTGLSGMAGNKGAVAIRLDYANTPICFVTAHLAAGFGNYDERNRDYTTIHHGLRFQRNRGIDDHDVVVWLGDFNYRIGLANETARSMVKRKDLQGLYENDQLNLQMVAGLAFPYYSEARITFMPTYRFDVGTDNYDTSEKARVPAWTDRILRKGSNIRQLSYDSAPLRFSDHRPVYATFDCTVTIIDEAHRESISQELYARRKAEIGDTSAHGGGDDDTEDEDLIGYDAIEPGLPPASSDRNRWWLDNKQPARAEVPIPSSRNGGQPIALNPNRPANPFRMTEEPDWVSVPRSSPGVSSLSSSPYEKVQLPGQHRDSRAAAGGAGRRLPPPLETGNLAAKVGAMNIGPETTLTRKAVGSGTDAPPPPPPRRGGTTNSATLGNTTATAQQPGPVANGRPESVTSQGSDVSQQGKSGRVSAPPPIARKPAHLSTTSSPSAQRSSNSSSADFQPPLPARTNTASTSSSTGTVSRAESISRKPLAAPPSLPARQGTETNKVDLLDSLEESTDSVGGWETLEPSR